MNWILMREILNVHCWIYEKRSLIENREVNYPRSLILFYIDPNMLFLKDWEEGVSEGERVSLIEQAKISFHSMRKCEYDPTILTWKMKSI